VHLPATHARLVHVVNPEVDMDTLTLSYITAMAITGYGEVQDGQPSWAQRELHVYTNMVRVDPESWSAEYACSLSEFTSAEREPRAPLYFHDGLASIAQSHSQDMSSHDFMAHESSDGTDFGTRVWPWYSGTMIGENVAYGYADNWDVVLEGWMCSAGHRSNIMAGDFEDIGPGVVSRSYTQDFGAGAGTPHIQIAMGVHLPQTPTREVEFLATFEDDEAPNGIWVETTDDCLAMEPLAGDDLRGAWSVEASSEDGCAQYRFTWESGSGIGGSLPETGSYLYGDGCPEWTDEEPTGCTADEEDPSDPNTEDEDDSSSDPEDEGGNDGRGDDDLGERDSNTQSDCPGGVGLCLEDSDGDKIEGKGCSTAPSRPGATLLLGALFGLASRRRRR